MQYATIADYYAYQGKSVPDDLTTDQQNALNSLLQRASDRVITMTRTARYSSDTDGMPSPEGVREAFRRATSAQAIHMRRLADEGDTSAADGWDAISLIGVSFSRNQGAATAGGYGEGGRYSFDARDILVGAGIYTTAVAHPGV